MILYGKQIFLFYLEKLDKKIKKVYLGKECESTLFNRIRRLNIPILRVDSKKAQAMARGGNHQGFLFEAEDIEFVDLNHLKKSNFIVVLCGLTDTGNIGAIIRTAYALGIDGVVIGGVKSLNFEGVVRSSSAAASLMPIVFKHNLLDIQNSLKTSGFVTIGASMSGEDIREFSTDKKKALFVGNEALGIPQKLQKKLDFLVSIKMKREFDSLNVHAATAILCDRMR